MSSNYNPVRTVFFNKFDSVPCDLFIRLSDEKFVKVLNKNDAINPEFINKYVSKKIFEFFLTEADFKEYSDLIFDFHSNAKEILVEGRKIQVPNNDGLNHMIETMGVSEKETKRINEMSTRIITDLNTDKSDITSLLSKFTTSKDRFPYDHSYLTAVMSCQIAGANEWGSNMNKEKLCLASIIHELGHTKENSSTQEESINAQDISKGVNPISIDKTKTLAANLRKVGKIPIDVISIIENSFQLNQSNLSPMTCCFIVGHQFVIELYKCNFDQSKIDDICQSLEKTFPEGNLRKQVDNLRSTL